MNEPFTTLACGSHIDLNAPDLTGVSLETVATHLSKICRFNGACHGMYTVARHSVLGALALKRTLGDGPAAAFLMHDINEAVIGDITTPVAKAIGGQVHNVKIRADIAVSKRFDVELERYATPVYFMDREMLYNEWVRLMPGTPESVGLELPDVRRLPVDLVQAIGGRDRTWREDFDSFMKLADILGVR